jgi:hypothetical protein
MQLKIPEQKGGATLQIKWKCLAEKDIGAVNRALYL